MQCTMVRNDAKLSKPEYRPGQGFSLPRTHGRFRPVFTEQLEGRLREHIQEVANVFGGLSRVDIRRLAFEFALRNGIENNFNKSSRMAGKDWVRGFLKRNSDLVQRIRAESNKIQLEDLISQLEKDPEPIILNELTHLDAVKEDEFISAPPSVEPTPSPEDYYPSTNPLTPVIVDETPWFTELTQLQSSFLDPVCCEMCNTPPWYTCDKH